MLMVGCGAIQLPVNQPHADGSGGEHHERV
jgi:hypothetical protein